MIVRQLMAGDVAVYRLLRLEALRLEPDSFSSTFSDWSGLTDAEWARQLTAHQVLRSSMAARRWGWPD